MTRETSNDRRHQNLAASKRALRPRRPCHGSRVPRPWPSESSATWCWSSSLSSSSCPLCLSAVTAFKTLPDIQANPVSLVADPAFGGWTTEGVEALNSSRVHLPRWTVNSVIVTVFVVLLRITFGSLAGYALARMRFPGRGWIFALVLAVQAIPGNRAGGSPFHGDEGAGDP